MKGKLIKRATALLSTAAMLLTCADFSAIDFSVQAEDDEPILTDFDVNGNGIIEEGENKWGYKLDSASDLYWFADKVNNDNENYGDANAFLACDITVNTGVLDENGEINKAETGNFTAWTPIGYYNDKPYFTSRPYEGTFDGAGYRVSGLYFCNDEQDNVGLFGYVVGGTIKNVTVADSCFGGQWYVGGVCGNNIGGTIENCCNEAEIEGTLDIGGICGYTEDSTIIDCSNQGLVTSDTPNGYAGGICGSNNSTVTGCSNTGLIIAASCVGGICGYNGIIYGRGEITDCSNSGKITGGNFRYNAPKDLPDGVAGAGGICGYNYGGGIANCSNTGEIYGRYYLHNFSDPNDYDGSRDIGGVCGKNEYGTLENCHSTGKVSGVNDIGGVCGLNNYKMINCSNAGNIEGISVLSGNVTCVKTAKNIGGVCGYCNSNDGLIKNCYNTGDVSGYENAGGVCAYIAEGLIENCYNTGNALATGSDTPEGSICALNENGKIKKCYYLKDDDLNGVGVDKNDAADVKTMTDEQFASGEVCKILNDNLETEPVFFQTLGEDASPVLDSTHKSIIICNKKYTNGHKFSKKGICKECGTYQPATLTDGKYQISNAGQLYWFAERVKNNNDNYGNANAELTNDITVNEELLSELITVSDDGTATVKDGKEVRVWTPIGGHWDSQYSGTFDGRGYTISGLYFDESGAGDVGLFGAISEGTIKNVTVADSYFCGSDYVSGICGFNDGTIEKCFYTGKVVGHDYVGGICGWNEADSTINECSNTGNITATGVYALAGGICGGNYAVIENSYNTGDVTGAEVGGICGYNKKTISNCYNTGKITGTEDADDICGWNEGTIENCYYLADVENGNGGKNIKQFKSGEVCYLLNGGETQSATPVFFQNIGTDESPVLDSTHNMVYKNKACDGVSDYFNNKNENQEHSFNDTGVCKNCGAFEDGIGAKLAGYSLSLDGSIGVNFYMELSEDVIADGNAYLLVTYPNGSNDEIFVRNLEPVTMNGKSYYVFQCKVAATEMADTITAQMMTSIGNGTKYSYSVKEYADYLLAHTEDNAEYAEAEKLVRAMLNYGAYAQTFKGHNTDTLPCELADLENYEINEHGYSASAGNTVEFAGANLSMLSNTTLRLFFEADDINDVTIMYGSEKLEIGENNGLYFVEIANISPDKLSNDFTVSISDNGMVTYSPMTYCYQVSKNSDDAAFVNLVKAIAKYNDAAKAYFKEAM